MIFGVATWALQGDSLPQRFRKLGEMGFQAMSMVAAQLCEAEQDWGDIQRTLEQYDLLLTLHLCCGTSGRPGLDESLPPMVSAVAEWQERCGRIANVTFDSAYRPDEKQGDKVWNKESTIEGLRYARDHLAPHGVRVGIENWLINHRLDQFQAIKDGVGRENLGMLLDVGHLNIALRTPEVAISSAAGWIQAQPFEVIELHLHDNDGKLDQHLPLGEGTVDLRPMVSALHERGFDGIATVELIFRESRLLDDDAVRNKLTKTRDAFAAAFKRS